MRPKGEVAWTLFKPNTRLISTSCHHLGMLGPVSPEHLPDLPWALQQVGMGCCELLKAARHRNYNNYNVTTQSNLPQLLEQTSALPRVHERKIRFPTTCIKDGFIFCMHQSQTSNMAALQPCSWSSYNSILIFATTRTLG